MQLPRLAVLLAVYSGVHAALSPEEPTGKPEIKLESNQTGGARFLAMGGSSGFTSPGFGGNGLGSYQPQYVQSSAQAQVQSQAPVYSSGSQPQVYRVPTIQATPYRTQPQYTPYSGMSGGVVESIPSIADDSYYPSASSKFGLYPGVSMNSGSSSSGSLGGMNLPQTLTVFGNIPVSVSGTVSLGVRGQLTVMQDGGAGSGSNMHEGASGISIGSSPYTHQGSPSYTPYQGSSGGSIMGSFPASQQSPGMVYTRPLQTYNGRTFNYVAPYQPSALSPVSPYAQAIEGPFNSIGSQFLKSQIEESGQTQMMSMGGVSSQVLTDPNSGNSGNSDTSPVHNSPMMPYQQLGYSPGMGSSSGIMGSVMSSGQSGLGMQKQIQMNSMGGGQIQQQSYLMPRPGGGQSPYNMRFGDAVARALNEEPSEKTQS